MQTKYILNHDHQLNPLKIAHQFCCRIMLGVPFVVKLIKLYYLSKTWR